MGPRAAHANKTLKCVVEHAGLSKDVSAGTKVKIVGGEEGSVSAAGLSTGGLVGIVFAIIVVFVVAGIAALAWRGKLSKKEEKVNIDEEKGAEAEADKTSQTESAHDETNTDEVKTEVKKI